MSFTLALGSIRDHVRISNSGKELVVFRENRVLFVEHGLHPGAALSGRYGFLPRHGGEYSTEVRCGEGGSVFPSLQGT